MARYEKSETATLATLRAQVEGLDEDQKDLRAAITGLDRKIEKTVGDLSQEFRAGLATINASLVASSKTPWGVIFTGAGVMIAFVSALGIMAYSPLQLSINDLKADAKQVVPRIELETRWSAQAQSYSEILNGLRRLRDDHMVTRRKVEYLEGRLAK